MAKNTLLHLKLQAQNNSAYYPNKKATAGLLFCCSSAHQLTIPMNRHYLTPSTLLSLALALFMLALSTSSETIFNALSLRPEAIKEGEVWRLVTGNLVHFGWAHTLMNVAAFLLCSFALLAQQTPQKFIALFIWCCVVVGLGIYYLNPEYLTYAGLSGTIHGLIVVGLAQSLTHPLWIRLGALALLIAKLWQEHSPNYVATDLQTLVPVAIATDAHFYGAIAGIAFVAADYFYEKRLKATP